MKLVLLLLFLLPSLGNAHVGHIGTILDFFYNLELDELNKKIVLYNSLVKEKQKINKQIDTIEEEIGLLIEEKNFTQLGIKFSELEDLYAQLAQISTKNIIVVSIIAEKAKRVSKISEKKNNISKLAPRLPDPISGIWKITLLPFNQEGVLELTLEGTLVRGIYRLDGDYWGSIRGEYINGEVRLDRLDSKEGYSMVLRGRVVENKLVGSWEATLLSSPGPARGEWIAEKVRIEETE